MARWKPSVVYLRGAGLVGSLRTARIRLRPLPDQSSTDNCVDDNRVEVMWDYMAFPVWGRPAPGIELDRAIDGQLRTDLQDWSDRVSGAKWGPSGPDAPGWDGPSADIVEAFNAEGRALTRRLQDALGPETTVVYESI